MKKLRLEFADTMLEVGKKDPRLVVMVGDISHTILQPFAQACPGRYFNIGICEPTIVNMAAGLAKTGLIPVIHTIAPFIIERSYEQIKLDFGYQNLSGNFISVGSAFDYSQLGCSHHCYTDIPLMMHFKRSQIFFPGSAVEFQILFKAVYNQPSINYFRLPEKTHEYLISPEKIQVGKAIKICEGDCLTIIVIGSLLSNAMAAVEILRQQDTFAEVLYLPTIKPLDSEAIIESAAKTKNILVIEEVSQYGGVCSLVLDATKKISDVRYSSISIRDFCHSYGSYEELCDELGFSVRGIVEKIEKDFNFSVKQKRGLVAR